MIRNMETAQELPRVAQVQLHQKYWVTEDSKVKLLTVGAKCLDIVTEREHYYDTDLDELATAQLWLSKRNQQWSLILESQKQPAEENPASSAPEIREPLYESRTENTAIYRSSQERKAPEMLCVNDQNNQQQDLNEEDTANASAISSSTYAELVEEREIITYLADFLHIDLKTKKGSVTMEDFLQKAGIQHYASNHTVHRAKYKLANRYTIIIQRDEISLEETATILLDVDISNICKGFEEIEKLANYLGFVQNVQGLTVEHIKNRQYDRTPVQFS
nr:uncharacterized protein LOC110082967 isoform X2 [Pogona vitticeps]